MAAGRFFGDIGAGAFITEQSAEFIVRAGAGVCIFSDFFPEY